MNTVYACIDGQASATAATDGAIWAAQRLSAPLRFFHVLERHPERATSSDLSGAIGLGAHEALLDELSGLDARRSTLAQEAARQWLAGARRRAEASGLADVDIGLRHGDLIEAVGELQPSARLFVLGRHGSGGTSRLLPDRHVEGVVGAVEPPVMVVPGPAFAAPGRAVVAFDGSATAARTVQRVAGSPLLVGLPLVLAMAAAETASLRAALEEACAALCSAGFQATPQLLAGEPRDVLLPLLAAADTLLVMGAYGHSRIRRLLLGSTTTTLLRTSPVPVLVIR